jgi:large subunit ribosomal protein L31
VNWGDRSSSGNLSNAGESIKENRSSGARLLLTDGSGILIKRSRKEVILMKEGIHPDYKKSIVTCVCGNTFETRSTAGNLKLEICSNCHPFFTGRQKLVDSAGRVERYNKKYGKKAAETRAT